MKTLRYALPAALVVLTMSACDNDDSPMVMEPPPPPPAPVAFTTFVKDQVAQTADDTDPLDVDTLDLEFSGDDDPDAYDELFE